MKLVSKRLITAFVFLMITSSFSGCNFNLGTPGPYMGNETALFTMATFSIPKCDQIGTKIEKMETDAQGRTLFKTIMGNDPLYYCCFGEESPLYAFSVCQHCDDEKVYYYEDECWVLFANAEDFTEEEKEQLKERNDWDLPLNYDKMTAKTIIPKESQGRKNYPNEWKLEEDAKERFLIYNSLEEGERVFSTFLDDDGEGRMIFTILVEARDGDNWMTSSIKSIKSYMEIVDTNSHGKEAVIEEIQDPAHIWEQIKAFKAQNNWHDRG